MVDNLWLALGFVLGIVSTISCFKVAVLFIEDTRRITQAKVEARALPFVIKSDAQERQIELEQYGQSDGPTKSRFEFTDTPEGLGR